MKKYNVIVSVSGIDCTFFQGGFETIEEAANVFEMEREHINTSTIFSNPRIMEVVVVNGKVCFKEV